MYTLVDFITHVKGVEYLLALAGIAVFLVFWEFLKPAPFRTMANTGREDRSYIRESGGFRHIMKNVGRIVAAPFIGLAYVVMLPVMFFVALAAALVNFAAKEAARLAGKSVTFQWRPVEAYLAGRRKKREQKEKGPEKK